MMSFPPKQLSVFPNVPKDHQVVDKNGYLNPIWALYFQQLDTALQINFGREGIVVPSQLTADINTLFLSSVGTILYSSDDQVIKVAVPGIGPPPPPPAPPPVQWKTLTPT